MSIPGYNLVTKIQNGVFVVENNEEFYVVKKIEIYEQEILSSLYQSKNERSALKHIIGIHKTIKNGLYTFLVMKYHTTDLFTIVETKKLSLDDCRRYFRQIAIALSFCHSNGIAHMDVSLENFVLDEDNNIILIDFGLAIENKKTSGRCGKTNYMSPEVFQEKKYYPEKADSWSAGIVLFMMLTGSFLYNTPCKTDVNFILVFKHGINGLKKIFNEWKRSIDNDAIDLLSHLLCSQKKRYTMKEALSHPFLKIKT